MTRSLLIAGSERWPPIDETLEIEKGLTYDSDNCKFEIMGDQPAVGDSVLITDTDLGNIYGGVIVRCDAVYSSGPNPFITWAVECDDYSAILDRKLVIEVYESKTAAYIVHDILTKYSDGSFALDMGADSPTIEKIVFDYITVSECIKQIAEYIGWSWTISPDKVISFFNPAILLQKAPISLVPGGFFSNLKFAVDMTQIRNRVYVRGGKMLSDTQSHEWKADGVEKAWTLPFDPVEVSALTVAGVSKTIAEEKTVDETAADYFYNRKDRRLRTTKSGAAPASGSTLHIEYKDYVDVIDTAEDLDSMAAIAAVQGGTGEYEYTIADDKLITLEAVRAAGEADIRENANPKVSGSFDTLVSADTYLAQWQPGMVVTITLPYRGIDNQYLVQSVSMKYDQIAKGWLYTIKFGGRLIGIADFLKALVNNQRGETAKTDLIHKFVKQSETIAVSDELIFKSRSRPFFVETSAYGLITTA